MLPSAPGDDGDPGDGGIVVQSAPGADASSTVQRVFSVFVTSSRFTVGEVKNVASADAACTTLANAGAPVIRGKKWAAWLGDSNKSAKARLGSTPGPWARVDAVMVADDVVHLFDTSRKLSAPITIDDKGDSHDASDTVWTGTKANGVSDAFNCQNWQSSSASALVGMLTDQKGAWTASNVVECGGGSDPAGGSAGGEWGSDPPQRRLYCFEIQ